MALLPPNCIQNIWDEAKTLGLQHRRDAIFASSPLKELMGTIPTSNRPDEQLLLDLNKLNDLSFEASTGEIPFEAWLTKALELCEHDKRVKVLRSTLKEIRAKRASVPHESAQAQANLLSLAAISIEAIAELIDCVQKDNWKPNELLSAYFYSAGFEWSSDEVSAVSMIKDLRLRLWPNAKHHPLFVFILHLVEAARGLGCVDGVQDLMTWFNKQMAEQGMNKEAATALEKKVADDFARMAHKELHLLIILKKLHRKRFQVSAFRIIVPSDRTQWGRQDLEAFADSSLLSKSHTAKDLPDAINKLVKKHHGDLIATRHGFSSRSIELFVPFNLLDCDADRWKLAEIGPLGANFRVILRSFERSFKDEDLYSIAWCDRWEAHRKKPVIWPPDQEFGHPMPSDITCAMLHSVPDDKDSKTPLLQKLIQGGVPIIIWPRKTTSQHASLHDFLHELRKSDAMCGDLRDAIYGFRRKACTLTQINDDHPGAHLSLLWDDPDKPRQGVLPALCDELEFRPPT